MNNLTNFCEFSFVYGLSSFLMMTMMEPFLSDEKEDSHALVWTILTYTPMLNSIFAIIFALVLVYEYILRRM